MISLEPFSLKDSKNIKKLALTMQGSCCYCVHTIGAYYTFAIWPISIYPTTDTPRVSVL